MHRFWLIVGLLMVLLAPASLAWADAANPQPQVAAAMASAVDHLASDIQAEPITSSLNVKTFLDRTNSLSRLTTVLQQAQQIGGPRWIDDQTCQVQVDISADVVRHQLQQIAIDNPKTTPIAPDELAGDLKSWDSRAFSATGTSTQRIDLIRPPASSLPWRDANEQEILQGVTLARQDAVNMVLNSIAPIPLTNGASIGDALAIPNIGQAMAQWVGQQPITVVDFRDDRTVQVTLSVSSSQLCENLKANLTWQTAIPLPADEKDWSAIAAAISQHVVAAVGQSPPSNIPAQATQPAEMDWSGQPPDWVYHQLDAVGNGTAQTQLLSARAAQLAASNNLRRQIEELPMPNNQTLKNIADQDPRISAAIDRALTRTAHVYSIDYQPDGSVTVRISLDLQDLWEAIVTAK
jgi:hypothetical protein